MLNRLLFTKIDNAPLIIFRVFFGTLIALESFGAILTGWVKANLVDPEFNFSFIGFEWLRPLPGLGMYFYFAIMGALGICIALGYRYRWSIIGFTLLWTSVYLMQKTSYNNHYYLLVLISGFMIFFPANRYLSIDAKKRPEIERYAMAGWVKWTIVLQLFLVYTYAGIAKLYGDWLDFRIIGILMHDKADYPIIGNLLQEPWAHRIIGTFGILFDLCIVPALLWRPTRKIAFVMSLFFHLFNSIVFQIGIFPYLSLAFMVFFFEPKTIRNLFFKKKPFYDDHEIVIPSYRIALVTMMGLYFSVQIALPLRHLFIKDNVLWTEEGHRLSWRMMLRSRTGTVQFKVVNRNNGQSETIDLGDYLTTKQQQRIGSYPDFLWQFAQYLKKRNMEQGKRVSVFAINSKVSINGKPYRSFIDPKVDLANERWDPFRHHQWILPSGQFK